MRGLYAIKPWFVRRLRRVEDVLVRRRVHPDMLSAAAVGVSAMIGICIVAGQQVRLAWAVLPVLALVRLALNALDGSVARRTRTARPLGALLNEAGDRASDVLAIGAMAFVAGPWLGLGALAAALIASASGVLAHALTGARDCGGPMGKADRMAVLALAGAVAAATASPVPFAVAAVTIVIGSLATAVARARRTGRALEERPTVAQIFHADVIEFPLEETIDVVAG